MYEEFDFTNYNPDEQLDSEDENTTSLVVYISTCKYMEGTPPKGAEWSVKCLEESASDFHKKKSLLSGLHDCAVL